MRRVFYYQGDSISGYNWKSLLFLQYIIILQECDEPYTDWKDCHSDFIIEWRFVRINVKGNCENVPSYSRNPRRFKIETIFWESAEIEKIILLEILHYISLERYWECPIIYTIYRKNVIKRKCGHA